MIDYKYKDLYLQDSVDKQLRLEFSGGEVITNEDIYAESMELTESLCSESQLTFGCCEASVFKIKIANSFVSHIGQTLVVSETLNGNTDEPFVFGTYTVISDKPTADRIYREIEAYDKMYDIINAEVSDWYNTIIPNKETTVTMKQFRDSFMEYFGIEQEEIQLVNDSMVIEQTITPSELSGKDVITAICEINGCFGHIGRDGKFQYIYLQEIAKALYPANDLFPSNTLLPSADMGTEKISNSHYISCQYEDFETKVISKLQIRQEENDIGAIAGTGDNCYIIEDNFLVYGKNPTDLKSIATNVFSAIAKLKYRPVNIEAVGNPCLTVGDGIRITTKYEIIYSYILNRTLKGIQALRDEYESEGTEEYAEKVNSVNKSIIQLKGKTNTLERNVEETKAEVKDIEQNLSTRITQNAQSITLEATRAEKAESDLSQDISDETERAIGSEVELAAAISINADNITSKVSKGDVSSEISQESDKISIKSNRLSIESDNFELTEDGKIIAKSGDIAGWKFNEKAFYKNSEVLGDPDGVYLGAEDGFSYRNLFVVGEKSVRFSSMNYTNFDYSKKVVMMISSGYQNNFLFYFISEEISDKDIKLEFNISIQSTEGGNYREEITTIYLRPENMRSDGTWFLTDEDVLDNFAYNHYTINYVISEITIHHIDILDDQGVVYDVIYPYYSIPSDAGGSEIDMLYGKISFPSTECEIRKDGIFSNGDFKIAYTETDETETICGIQYSRIQKVLLDKTKFIHMGIYDTTTSSGSAIRINEDGKFYRYVSSSKRYKENITTDIPEELNPHKLYDLDVCKFNYKDGYLSDTDQRSGKDFIGFIAEDLYEKYAIACNLDAEGLPEVPEYNMLIAPMLKLIQEQKQEIESLKEELKKIKEVLGIHEQNV